MLFLFCIFSKLPVVLVRDMQSYKKLSLRRLSPGGLFAASGVVGDKHRLFALIGAGSGDGRGGVAPYHADCGVGDGQVATQQ